MLKTLPLLVGLLFGAAGCKKDSASTAAQTGSGATAAGETAGGSGIAPGARVRNGKVNWKPMRRDASGQWIRPDHGPMDDATDDESVGRAERRADRMAKIDTDGDGKISDEERIAAQKARAAEIMAHLDTNGDGVVSDEEQHAAQVERADRLRGRLDTDGNGKLSVEEMKQSRFSRLDPDALDKNKDGEISADELASGMPTRKRFGGPGGPGGPGSVVGGPGGGGPAPAPGSAAPPAPKP